MIDTGTLTEAAVKMLFTQHYAKLVSFAARYVERDAAEDLVQDVFVQLLQKCGKLTIGLTLEAYVYRAIKNKYIDLVRKRHTEDRNREMLIKLAEAEFDNETEKNEILLEAEQRDKRLAAALQSLPDKCRQIMECRYVEGKRAKQISDELGISTRTVETHLYKAVRQLRVALRNVSLFFFL
ncbi:RNA polymerase sigma-70 factor [Pedobacter sp. SYP-B3415]|uniref:RNA polymerase sigma-70 factor n=1 Tax=Pedobacter sp. SYP-B3415 TaxID=2496641 RepID=UPI00101DD900|nr:RNA polymerase sigma-70 factor [Pedobacter sp. SYP-B3415]